MNILCLNKRLSRQWLGATGTTIAVSAAICTFFVPNSAIAQQGSAGALLEEIVTVARKRSNAEAVQDVPVAVTAFGAEQIDALFVKKLDDLSHMMPNVQLEEVGTFPGVQNFSIRGQGINSSIPSVDPTVGVFVDGVYLGTTFGVVIDMFDLEAIEVLRGPQGLLFGRNVTGGAVLLRNARPTGEFGFKARIGATDEDEVTIAAAVEGSMIEGTLAGKVAVYLSDDDGYFKNSNQSTVPAAPVPGAFYVNPATTDRAGAMKTQLVRPSFVWTPNDYTAVTLIAENGRSDGHGASWTNVTAQRAGAQPDFETTLDEAGFTDLRWSQIMLEFNVDDFLDGTLTNISGWRHVEVQSATDVDGTNLPIFMAIGDTDSRQYSNELRWSGSISDNWEATIGLYHFDMDVKYNEGRYIQGGLLLRALGGNMDARNTGVFWSNDFHFGDAWTASVGLRYTDETKTAKIVTDVCADVFTFNCTVSDLSGEWSNVTPKLGLERNFGDDLRIYGFWSKGYRSGGFNFRNAKPTIIPPGPTNEEENNTFEVGLKTEFMNGRGRLNVAVFHNKIDDMQRELNLGDPDVVVLQGTINAGDVTIQGAEVDVAMLISDNFSMNAAFGWQDGEYDRVNPAFASFIGTDLPRLAPKNASIGFSWDLPMGDAGLFNIAGNYSYRDENFYNDSNSELFAEQKRINASINYLSGNDRWRVSLYGKNLGDERNWGNLTSIAGLFTAGPMQKGRQVGVEINYQL